MVCLPLREITHKLKLVDYLLVQEDKQRHNFNYYIEAPYQCFKMFELLMSHDHVAFEDTKQPV